MKSFPFSSVLPRLGLVAGLAWYSRYFFTANMRQLGDDPGVLHLVHLVFHEAGHALLMWAPRLLYVMGGTLGQLAMPLALMIAFAVKNRDGYSAAICGWWFGHSLVDVAPYINDARMMQLELLGGGTGMEIEGHDWNFILDQLGLLKIDIYLSRDVLLAGRIVMALSLLIATFFVIQCSVRLPRSRGETKNSGSSVSPPAPG